MTHVPPQLAVFPPADGATNFARDDALLAAARATGGVLIRVYAWDGPVISFGRNERVAGRFDPVRIQRAHMDVVRRPTGGRALLHHHELTYAIAGPAPLGDTLHAAYDRISAVLVIALQRLGVEAVRAVRQAAAPALDGTPCFAVPSAGEIVVGGRKLVASAQWREAGAFLQHGSVLIDNDQPLLGSGLVPGTELPPLPPPATLRELLGRVPTMEEFAEALAAAYEITTGEAPDRTGPERIIADAAASGRLDHYRDPDWTWRR